MITIYEYVAANHPDEAAGICNKYGYSIQGVADEAGMASCLEQLVSREGKDALLDIVAIHPDKEIILEANNVTQSKGDKKCKCQSAKKDQRTLDSYLNATGSQAAVASAHAGNSLLQGNTMIIAAALILAVAIVSK